MDEPRATRALLGFLSHAGCCADALSSNATIARQTRGREARRLGQRSSGNARRMELGYAISSEHSPLDLVRNAAKAEESGFSFALISDHYHPWTDRQGESPFVWSVLGGIAASTERITIGTGVTALSVRIHPAILAQATATVADMLPGRFWFGVGTGENLNEHILGDAWPEHARRAAMMEEAIELIRRLWTGELIDHHGAAYRSEERR